METTFQSINVETTRLLGLYINETRVSRWNRDRNGPFKDEVTTVSGTGQNTDKKLLETANLFIALIRYWSVQHVRTHSSSRFSELKFSLLVLFYVFARFYRAVDELADSLHLLHTVTRYFFLSFYKSLSMCLRCFGRLQAQIWKILKEWQKDVEKIHGDTRYTIL